MNTKKIIGLLCWLLAFAIPARYALLESETVGNIPGLISFVSFMFLIFIGYYLVDSSSDKKASHGH
ncbi:MAG TPA: hypothetical protein PK760_14075 [Flavobacteriales bacterium]|nr:hypothetical protein [Flavobacteriales bacterium]